MYTLATFKKKKKGSLNQRKKKFLANDFKMFL